MDIDINNLASQGVINDVPGYMLPPEAWTLALNMRYKDGAPEALLGWEQVFGTPGVVPYFLMPVPTQSTNYWLYAGLQKIYIYDGAAHSNISRTVGGNYGASNAADWNSTMLGGIPVFNNGVDVPQFRADMALGTKFENLTNWPAGWRAKVLRAFGPFLMAFNLTKAGSSQPHTLNWSHPADPGTVPSSWDDTDATKDAGIKDFEDVQAGILRDALPLGGTMYVYKDNSTWRANFIGGRDIFDFKTLFETSGILAARCVAVTGDGLRQTVVTQDDMIFHRGDSPVSILDKRQRSRLFGEMDTENYINSFLFSNPLQNEMWFCYPTTGNANPNKALIWNYREGGERGVISYADGITFRHAAIGNVEGDTAETWADGTDTWDEDTGPWSEFTRRRVVVTGTNANRFFNLDRTNTRDGSAFTSTLQREGLAIIGRTRGGEWIVDHQYRKLFQRLWPKLQGGPVNIRLGSQEEVNGAITWGTAVEFDPTVQRAADNDPIAGAAVGLEISSSGKGWRLDGYKAQIEKLGMF